MDRSRRMLTIFIAMVAMAWLTSCSKPAPQEAAAPGGATTPAPGAADKAGAADKPAAKPGEMPELEALKTKVAGLKSYHLKMTLDGKDMAIYAKLADGKPQKMRMESAQMPGYMIYDLGSKSIYMVNDKTNEAMKMAIGDGEKDKLPDNVGDSIDQLIAQKPKLSSEKIDGIDCWKAVMKEDKAESTAWFAKETGLPMQVKQGDKTIKMTYTDINKVADSQFELPRGITVKDMGDLAKKMSDKAK